MFWKLQLNNPKSRAFAKALIYIYFFWIKNLHFNFLQICLAVVNCMLEMALVKIFTDIVTFRMIFLSKNYFSFCWVPGSTRHPRPSWPNLKKNGTWNLTAIFKRNFLLLKLIIIFQCYSFVESQRQGITPSLECHRYQYLYL